MIQHLTSDGSSKEEMLDKKVNELKEKEFFIAKR